MSWHWSLLTRPQSAKMTGEQFRCVVIWLLPTAVECKRDQCWSVYAYIVLHRESKKNNKTPKPCPHLRQILIDFRHFFTVTLGRKFAIKRSLQIQPNIKVATLPCEILVSKNCSDWQHSSSTPSARRVRALLRNVTVIGELLSSNLTRQKFSVQHVTQHNLRS